MVAGYCQISPHGACQVLHVQYNFKKQHILCHIRQRQTINHLADNVLDFGCDDLSFLVFRGGRALSIPLLQLLDGLRSKAQQGKERETSHAKHVISCCNNCTMYIHTMHTNMHFKHVLLHGKNWKRK